jgi:dihydroorotase
MSKFLVLGMDLNAIVAAVTAAPARAIRRPSLGTLAVGTEGDATILDVEEGTFEFRDTQNEVLTADQRLRSQGIIIGGKLWPADCLDLMKSESAGH